MAAEGVSDTRPGTVWSHRLGGAELRFVGRAATVDRQRALNALGIHLPLAWLQQIHSARAFETGVAGLVGQGDALVTDRPGLALAIAVADCVPVAIAGADRLALVHAGWRGVVAGVVEATIERAEIPPPRLGAWIGPAIGPCCYEVGREIATRVAAASGPEVVTRADGEPRPRLDLYRAVEIQLRRAGVERIESLRLCTRCHPESLWSYRRDGDRAGRNFLFGWLDGEGPS